MGRFATDCRLKGKGKCKERMAEMRSGKGKAYQEGSKAGSYKGGDTEVSNPWDGPLEPQEQVWSCCRLSAQRGRMQLTVGSGRRG